MPITRREIERYFFDNEVIFSGGERTKYKITIENNCIRVHPTGAKPRRVGYDQLSVVIDNFQATDSQRIESSVGQILQDNNLGTTQSECDLYGVAREYLERKNRTPTADRDELEKRVAALLNDPNLEKPEGVKKPKRREQTLSVHERDPKVKAWIIKNAKGKCECCGDDGFIKEDGNTYLEVHHLRLLSENGSDTPQNAIALCANCHCKLHYAKNKEEMRKDLIKKIERLQEE